jgi:protein-L-isoaspartate O-methyltransferase
MTEQLELTCGMKILEIGTGSGYHPALCSSVQGKPEQQGEKAAQGVPVRG